MIFTASFGLGNRENRVMNRILWAFFQIMVLACAGLTPPAWAQIATTLPCNTMNAQSARIGTKCETSTGSEFRRYVDASSGALGWLELGKGGKVWYDAMKVNTAQPEAAKFCAEHPGQSAPTLEDFDRAAARGFRDVVRNNLAGIKNPLLWSAAMDETSHGQRAVGYALDKGDFHSALIDQPFDNAVIICVGPAPLLQ
jgi:hypothetical protein